MRTGDRCAQIEFAAGDLGTNRSAPGAIRQREAAGRHGHDRIVHKIHPHREPPVRPPSVRPGRQGVNRPFERIAGVKAGRRVNAEVVGTLRVEVRICRRAPLRKPAHHLVEVARAAGAEDAGQRRTPDVVVRDSCAIAPEDAVADMAVGRPSDEQAAIAAI